MAACLFSGSNVADSLSWILRPAGLPINWLATIPMHPTPAIPIREAGLIAGSSRI
jgi:hypothetical protein